MPLFRATVYHLSASVAAVEGHAGITRCVVEREAETVNAFAASVMDDFSRDVDDDVSFGPISQKKSRVERNDQEAGN